jgi:Domain of unknown function (DUF1330)
MSVYVIAAYDIVNPKGYEGYVPGVAPLLQKHGAEILAADYEAKALEGRASGVNVLLKFASWGGGPQLAQRRWLRPGETDPAEFDERRIHRDGKGIQGAGDIAGNKNLDALFKPEGLPSFTNEKPTPAPTGWGIELCHSVFLMSSIKAFVVHTTGQTLELLAGFRLRWKITPRPVRLLMHNHFDWKGDQKACPMEFNLAVKFLTSNSTPMILPKTNLAIFV